MATNTAATGHAATLFLLIGIFGSCDTFRENDVVRPSLETSDYYTAQNGVVLIDLSPLIHDISGISQLAIAKHPIRGSISAVNDLLFRYDPNVSFLEGTDKIIFVITDTNGMFSYHTTTIHATGVIHLPCGVFARQDKVKITGRSAATIHPLHNDRFCSTDVASISLDLLSEPKYGQATVQGQSIVYTPGASFTGYDEVIYALSRAGSDSIIYGLVSLANYATVTQTEPRGSYISQSVFLDEQTGFIFAGHGLDKTIDGGMNWSTVWERPWEEPSYCYGLLFLDSNRAYAAFGTQGLVWTTDGWQTWQATQFDARVVGVAFSSPDVGYLALETGEQYDPSVSIVKTENGGSTWKEVIPPSPSTLPGSVEIRFSDVLNGYVRFIDRILATTDGGNEWHTILSDTWIYDFCVAQPNEVFALTSEFGSIISKWADGGPWTYLPGPGVHALAIGFSPSGKVGYAVVFGPSDPPDRNPEFRPLLVFRTLDGGSTWTQVLTEDPIFGTAFSAHVPSDNTVYVEFSDRLIKYSLE